MFHLDDQQQNYTQVPNVVMDVYLPNMNNMAAIKCYMVLVRKTWGWGKTGDWLAMSQLVTLTKLSRQSITSGMNWLEEHGYIWKVKAGKEGFEKVMYFLCMKRTEHLENSFKQGVIKADKIFELMIEDRKLSTGG
jgi:hypothetical protein